MDRSKLIERIVIDPDVMFGKPTIRGTRLTVGLILDLFAQGIGFDDILLDYPNITKDDIFACFAYAKEAIEKPSFMPLGK